MPGVKKYKSLCVLCLPVRIYRSCLVWFMKERVIRQEGKAANIRRIMKERVISVEETYMDTSVRSNHLQDDHNP